MKVFAILLIGAMNTTVSNALTVPSSNMTPSTTSTQQAVSSVPTGEFMTTKYITIAGVTDGHVTLPPKTITIAIPTCIATITPDKNGYLPPGTCNALWDYYPSFGAAVVFAALFGILTVIQIRQAILYKKSFCWVVITFAAWETIAFTSRAISTRYQQSVGIYLVFQIFILLGPLWVNAFAYMVLGRMIHFFLPTHSLFSIPAATIAMSFVSLDLIAFVIQLVGGSWAGPTAPVSEQMKGVHIYMGGIGLQQFFILAFFVLAARFQVEMTRLQKAPVRLHGLRTQWRRLLFTLYAVLGFVTIRILFRLIEFSAGTTTSNPLTTKEAYFYVFEAVPMLLALLSFVLTHPGTILQGPDSELPGIWKIVKTKWQRRRGNLLLPDAASEDGMEMLHTK